MRWLSRLVSVAVTVAVLIGAVMLVRAKLPTTHAGGEFRVFARFRDGSRLAVGSPLVIAGVRIGEVSRLSVEGAFARVEMAVADHVTIPVDSWILKRAESAFGDSYLEIIPGTDVDSAATRNLASGEQIVRVIEGGSTDQVLRSIARALPRIERGLDTAHDVAGVGRKWVNGGLKDTIIDADRWVSEGHLDKPIDAAARAMASFESAVTGAANAVASAKPEVSRGIDRTSAAITSARRQMTDVKADVHNGFSNVRAGMDRVDPTIDEIGDVVATVNEGRGNDFKAGLGRVVNDTQFGATLDDLAQDTRDAVARVDPFVSWLGIRTEWNLISATPRFYITAELGARNDKFYVVEGSKSTQGALPQDHLADVVDAQTFRRYQQIEEGYRFTAQIGKRLGMFRVRGGVKESAAGIGADVLLNRGSLRFSADAYGGFDRTPRVKLAGALEVFRWVYILGGVDDLLNSPKQLSIVTGNAAAPGYFTKLRYGRDYFLGASIQFTDEDLAMLVRIYGAMLVGLAL